MFRRSPTPDCFCPDGRKKAGSNISSVFMTSRLLYYISGVTPSSVGDVITTPTRPTALSSLVSAKRRMLEDEQSEPDGLKQQISITPSVRELREGHGNRAKPLGHGSWMVPRPGNTPPEREASVPLQQTLPTNHKGALKQTPRRDRELPGSESTAVRDWLTG